MKKEIQQSDRQQHIFTKEQYTVNIPLNDTQWYDLIVEKDSKLSRVQVKATSCKTKYGVYL